MSTRDNEATKAAVTGAAKGATSRESERQRHKASTVRPAPGLRTYWVRNLLASALVLLAAALLVVTLVVKRDSDRDLRHLGATARLLAQGIAADLDSTRQRLDSLSTDEGLRAALESPRPEALRAAELGLQGRFPGALVVHLFAAPRIASAEGIAFMSYAGLDLARQAAQTRRVTLVEVHKVGQPDMHLAVAGPVFAADGEQVLGVAHLALPLSLLPGLEGALPGLGTAAYRQVVGAQAVPLHSTVVLPEDPPDEAVEIPGSRLQIAAWLGPRGLPDPELLGAAAAIYLVSLGALGALLWLGHRRLKADLREDTQGLVLMVEDALNQRPVGRTLSRIAETQRTQLELAAQLQALGALPNGRRQAAPKTGSGGGQGPMAAGVGPGGPFDGTGGAWDDLEDSEQLQTLEELDEELELPEPVTGDGGHAPARSAPHRMSETIFRAYDIRGLVDDGPLSADAVQAIGQALGSAAVAAGDRTLMIGRDSRPSSPELSAALAAGIRAAGAEVVDLGVVPAPLVYFACCQGERHAGAVVTGSHNPLGYNGIKPLLQGRSATAEEIRDLRRRIESGDLAAGSGGYRRQDPVPQYRAHIERDVALARNLKVAIDCGNGTASPIAPALYRALGCEVLERRCDLGGGLADPVPDPSLPEHLRPLAELVVAEQADIGLAFDGDGDRLGVVDSAGRFIPADRLLMLLATDVLSRNPGTDVIFDVKCSSHLAEEVRRAGGRPVMWRSGHAPLKAKLREGGALIAGELSGHLLFQERWFGFDDAIYAGARLLEVLSLDPRTSEEIFAALPSGVVTPELALPLEEGEPARIMESVFRHAGALEGAELILIDGLRAELETGWGLVRASNTEPKLKFRFEGEDPAALESIQARFRRLLALAAPGLELPF